MGLSSHGQAAGARCEGCLPCALRSCLLRECNEGDARRYLPPGTKSPPCPCPQIDISQCNEPYTTENTIPILYTSQADKDRLEQRIQKLKEQGLTHSLKKASGSSKKRKKNVNVEQVALGVASPTLPKPHVDTTVSKSGSNIKNQDTAVLTAKVLAEQEERNKRRKLGANDNVKSLFSSNNGMDEKHVDFMTRGFSIPADAKR